jgi:DNA-binding transcriptional MerR regulator
MDDRVTWTIAEVAERTGLTTHTLRYYERTGLLGGVPRAQSGHRRYGEPELRLLRFITKLRQTGMPIRRIREYVRLIGRGDASAPQRRAILEEHRRDVAARLEDLRGALDAIDAKIRLYATLEEKLRGVSPTERTPDARARRAAR